jgi:acyl dehydratase
MALSADVVRLNGECVARMALNFVVGDDGQAGADSAGCCSFREGRKAKNAARRRIEGIPFFEQIEIGDEIDLGGYTFGPAEIEEFLSRTGDGGTGMLQDVASPCVPAWHVPAAWMQCMVRHYEATTAKHKAKKEPFPRLGPAAGFKQLRWHRPIAVGEVISFRGWAERKLIIPSQKNWGLLVVGAEGFDSHGNTVVSFYPQMLLERAHPLQLN